MYSLLTDAKSFLIVLAAFTLVACGGGSSNNSVGGVNAETTLQGTAATGAALSGTVTVIDGEGNTYGPETIAAADGSFEIEVGNNPPFLLAAESADSSLTLYSFAEEGGVTANITQLTSLAVFETIENLEISLTTLFDNWGNLNSEINGEEIQQAVEQINDQLSAFLQAQGINPDSYDFFTEEFEPDGSGIDAVLDQITVEIEGSTVTVTGPEGESIDIVVSIDVSGRPVNINIPDNSTWSLEATITIRDQEPVAISLDNIEGLDQENLVPPISESELETLFAQTTLGIETEGANITVSYEIELEGDLTEVGDKLIGTVTVVTSAESEQIAGGTSTVVYTWTRQS